MHSIKKVVLAYSGGLDTSVIIPWLKENYGCEIIAVAADLGQGDELDGLEQKAKDSGASKLYVLDLKKELIEGYIWPMLKSGAKYENYLLGTAIARPIIAKYLVKVAKKEGADAIVHGATGKGNDQVRFELGIKAFAPDMEVIAPWRIWNIKSRGEEIKYAKEHGIPLGMTKETSYSKDKNIWHLSHEGLDLEDPANEPRYDEILEMGVSPEKAPDKAEYVTVSFVKGIPVSLDGVKKDPVSMIGELNTIGGRNGVGIVDIVENRLVGMKSRGVYETPGGAILYNAHEALESLVLDRDTAHCKAKAAQKFAELLYDGKWFTPLRKALSDFFDSTQANVTGEVKMKLYKGSAVKASVKSPYSLYDKDMATFDEDRVYDQKDAAGFINLFGLPLKVRAMLAQK